MEFGGSRYMSIHFVLLKGCIICGCVSAFLDNIAVVAFFIPILKNLSVKYGFSDAEVMMPMSYAAILGRTCTLIGTSTNLLAIDLATKNIEGFRMGMFDIGRIGLPIMLAGSLYIIIFAPIFFRGRRVDIVPLDSPKTYTIAMRICEGCNLVGKQLLSTKLLVSDDHVQVRSFFSQSQTQAAGTVINPPSEGGILKVGDVIQFETTLSSIRNITDIRGLEFLQIARDPEVCAPTFGAYGTAAGLSECPCSTLSTPSPFPLGVLTQPFRSPQQCLTTTPATFGPALFMNGRADT